MFGRGNEPNVRLVTLEKANWEEWDRLAAPGGVFLSSGRLRERLKPESLIGYVYDGSECVAVFCLSVVTRHEVPPDLDPYRMLLANAPPIQVDPTNPEWSIEASPATPFIPIERDVSSDDPDCCFPMVVVGAHSEPENALLLAPQLTSDEKMSVFDAIVDAAEYFGRERAARSVVLPYYPISDAEIAARSAKGLVSVPTNVRHIASMPATFEEYLAGLARRARSQARRRIRSYQEHGLRTEVLVDWRDRIPEIRALLEAFRNKHGHIDPDEVIRELNTDGIVSLVLGARSGDSLVGVCLAEGVQGRMVARAIGCSDQAPKGASVYFNLAYYELIRVALQCGVRHLDWGFGMTRMKVALGATASPRFLIIKHEDPALNRELSSYGLPRALRALELTDHILERHGRDRDEVARSIALTKNQLA
jgi:hypothetical protein